MAVYTVHQPPRDAGSEPERFVFVRDGFYFWAFLFGPLWMLWRRLWLVLLLYIGAVIAAGAVFWYLRIGGGVQMFAGFLLAVLTGIEAGSLWRWTLALRGWTYAGVVVGDDLESAERRFFDNWASRAEEKPAAAPPAALAPARVSSGVIGLFPEPGAPR